MRYWKFASMFSYEGNILAIKDVFIEYQTAFIGDNKGKYRKKLQNQLKEVINLLFLMDTL